jgi:pSer/pThr/pTyr-binding forkhead associated (FHA) protein/S1-C subfamily serine protease
MNNADDAPRLTLSDGQVVRLAGRMRLGRAGHNDIVLDDSTASREHAEIEVAEDQVMLRDLGSANGTFVNDAQLTAPQLLHDGDRICIGHTLLVFHQPQPMAPETPEAPAVEDPATLLWETEEPLWLVRADGQRFALTHSLRLGRASDNDLVLEDRSASQHHARINLDAGRATVTDLGSSNGTWVNGGRISAPHPLQHGDRLQVGDSLFTFQVEGRPLPAEGTEVAPTRRALSLGLLLGGGGAILLVGLLALVAVVLGALVLLSRGGATPTPSVMATPTPVPATATPLPTLTPIPSPSAAELRQRALRAAVIVFTPVEGGDDEFSTGSGSLLTPAGYILTNFHVVGDVDSGQYYNQYGITFVGLNWEDPEDTPNAFYLAEIVKGDQDLDLALLQVVATEEGDDLPPDLEFPIVPVGDSDTVGIGDELVVIGFPGLGGETVTLTRGTVSGFLTDEAGRPRGWIKTDAEINPGNSGGMAINEQGELIGVPTIVVSGREVTGKIGVIRPINLADPLIDEIR